MTFLVVILGNINMMLKLNYLQIGPEDVLQSEMNNVIKNKSKKVNSRNIHQKLYFLIELRVYASPKFV